MHEIKTITVYAASSSHIPPQYFQAARELGKLLAINQITCINGAGNSGLMATLTDAVLENGGEVCGIIPRFMVDAGWVHPAIKNLIVTPDMHVRKLTMAEKSDACIALPGGVGTLEELLEIIAWKQLGLYTHKVIILNVNGFYNDLLAMIDKLYRENFMTHNLSGLWQVADSPEEALHIILESEFFNL
ncbi:MAG: TIGR00730 family Rossman fold protein [Dysgonamonadaceae bacterium]|jgi:uncharacterized protein (TIGR00730 family)|nr:TIGR00730 family Rossman fold protein [Dysgonamonadaceae bacterium]